MNRFLFCIAFLLSGSLVTAADSFDVGGGAYRAMREVDVPSGTRPTVLVTQFLHQGLINLATKGVDPRVENAGKTVLVTTKAKKVVPFRILQLGPGDFCRIAIQLEDRISSYTIYYGVPTDKQPNNDVQLVPWTTDAGLLLETRAITNAFGMETAEQLKQGFEQASPIGASYVPQVMHGYNPMTFRREPFLSRYTGNLYIAQPGTYAILTSSHQASFLWIDGQVVAQQAGRRGRIWDANPEYVKRIHLTAGKHPFEYYHATGDDHGSMMAVWEFNPGEQMKRPELIPSEVFQSDRVVNVASGSLSLADSPAGAPDFEYRIHSSVPLPDNPSHMVAVQFSNRTASSTAARGKPTWNFGDGLTSNEANPGHVYLKPGIYDVELTLENLDRRFSVVNRIEIDQPHTSNIEQDRQPTLDTYLSVLEKYDVSKLDPESLLQLVEAFQAKIDLILNPPVDAEETEFVEPSSQGTRSAPRRRPGDNTNVVEKYRRLTAEAVRKALVENPDFKGDVAIHKLTLTAGSIARDYLLDWKLAGQIYEAAIPKLTNPDLAAECGALAADVALDMQDKGAAKTLLDAAATKIPKVGLSPTIGTFHRVHAEFLAETGDGEGANKALLEATRHAASIMHHAERTAMQGSASRSAEKFLQEKNPDRAIDELRKWQRDHPAAVFDGYMTLLFAKYWVVREKYPQAAALADRQIVLNPDSPYIDELLLVAAEAQTKAGKKDAAKAVLNSLIKGYPGSPLVEQAEERLKTLE